MRFSSCLPYTSSLHLSGPVLRAGHLSLTPTGCRRTRQLNVQAGTQFCDSRFQKEVASGQLSSSSLDAFCCVALAGVATEWLRCGPAAYG